MMLEELWNSLVNDIWFELTLILAVAIASNFLFARLGQPKIIGQILLGILIGPSVLGLITVNQTDTGDVVSRLAELGAIILLFMIGLECNMKEIYTKSSFIVAISGVIIPWIGGFLLADAILPSPAVGTKFAQSVIIGASLVATSVAITAGVMKELGVIGSKPAKVILGAAVVDDILGMIVLAISSQLAMGTAIQMLNIALILVAAGLFVALGIFVGTKVARPLINAVERKGAQRGIPESGFLLALTIAFMYAFTAEIIGISAIVGAFVAGTALATCEQNKKFHQRTEVLGWVFAPIFFLSLGILVNIRLSLEIWAFALVLTVVAVFTKLAGCGIPARLLGLNKRESAAVGLGMIPRMEIAMVIALYGLGKNIITQDIYSVIVLMGLLTALFMPPVLRWVMRGVPKTEETNQGEGAMCP